MGIGYILGCCICFTFKDLENVWKNSQKQKNNYFIIQNGNGMLCFCKEQIEKYYGINKKYNKKSHLLAAGDPPEEIYKILGSVTNDEKIDRKIFENIKNGYNFTDDLGRYPYYCKSCRKLETHYYFEMIKNKDIYVPEYTCKICSNILGIGNLMLENEKTYSSDQLKQDELIKLIDSISGREGNYEIEIKYKYNISNENDTIKITSTDTNNEEELLCNNCGNDKFSIKTWYYFD